jgi:1-acyl-sn-glycerol-3-phosphate acyltransferase
MFLLVNRGITGKNAFQFMDFSFLCCMGHGWRAFRRFLFFAWVTTWCIFSFLFQILVGHSRKEVGLRIRRQWLNRIPPAMGVRFTVEGIPYQGACLFVANHISYIDPIAVLMHVDAHVVAKMEIKRWPLVGLGAHLVGTIFVNREEKSSRRQTADTIQRVLEEGESILIFPEGTTSAGPGTLPFRTRSFAAAFAAGVPVQPVAIYYNTPKAAFIGEHTFLSHFFNLFGEKNLYGRVAFGPLLRDSDSAEQARHWIEQAQQPFIPLTVHDP